MSNRRSISAVQAGALLLAACGAPAPDASPTTETSTVRALVDQYATVRLTSDLSHLSDADKEVVRLLVEAVQPMDDVFWVQAYGDRDAAFALAGADDSMRRYIEMNYGPWDRLREDEAFVDGVGPKPTGANLYPADMTDDEFRTAAVSNPELRSLYTLVRRSADGTLEAVPYREAFREEHAAAAAKLREAAALATDSGLAAYLTLRASALEIAHSAAEVGIGEELLKTMAQFGG